MRGNQMRFIKLVGLAAIAMLMAVASIGTTSAMAEDTALCAKDQTPCELKNLVTHVHEVTLPGSTARFLSNLGDIKCDVLYLGDVTETGAPLTIEGNFTYTNCYFNGKEACTVTELNGPAEIEVLKEGQEKAEVTDKFEVEVQCGFFIECVFSSAGLSGTSKGPLSSSEDNGEVSFVSQEISVEDSFFCPETTELDITTTPLSATSLIGGSLRLRRICLENTISGGGPLGNNCTSYDANGNFTLGMVEVDIAVNEMACAWVLFPVGFYLDMKAGTGGKECDQTTKHTSRDTIYELGTVR
jgi:hypothetical protein